MDLLIAEFLTADVAVKKVPGEIDFRDNAVGSFKHNFVSQAESFSAGAPVRDAWSEADLWAVQVYAAYEYIESEDGDPIFAGGLEDRTLGNTDPMERTAINIYLETIRDTSQEEPDAVNNEIIAERTVLHETMHRFGHANHDIAIMIPQATVTGSTAENKLTPEMLREVMTRLSP